MSQTEEATRELLVELLGDFYAKGWISGTGGGICGPADGGGLLLAPTVWVIPANTPHGGHFEDAPQVLFISSPIDDPDNQDRVWID